MELYPFQRRAVRIIQKIWKNNSGAILRGDEGIGKTIITAATCAMRKTLVVAPARTLTGVREKLDQYAKAGIPTDIKLISYHHFADVSKISAIELSKYEIIVFDECHNLRNYKAGWTTRLCKLRHVGTDRKLLFLSATPMIKSPLDFIYVLRKTGVFDYMTMEELKIKYFDAKRSRYGDFLEMGEFRNAEDFQAHIDQVSYDIKQEEADSQMPVPNFNVHTIYKDSYKPPKDITEETAMRLEAGLKKVPHAVKYIKKDIRTRRIGISLILCHFHEVAVELSEKLGFRCALNSKEVRKEFKVLSQFGGHLVTTLGLTDSNLDLNECDTIYMVESTYSAMQDRQSIRRCIRVGKRTVVQVNYIMYKDEKPLLKSMSRLYLGTNLRPPNSKMGPSSLKRLEMCPGSYWVESTGENKFEAAAYFGTLAHSALERCLQNPDIDISEAYSKPLKFAIDFLRSKLKKQHGIESLVNLSHIHKDMYGTCDFWSYEDGYLEVYDYKNGVAKIKANDNLQLLAYAAMIQNTYQLDIKSVTLGIVQGGKVDSYTIDEYNVNKTVNRIKKIVKDIKKAKEEPLKHINQGKCDFFCPANRYHQEQREAEQLKQVELEEETMSAKGITKFKVEGYCIFYQERGERVSFGISTPEIPTGEIEKLFNAGSVKLIQKEFKFSPEYKNFSFFAGSKLDHLPKDQQGINPKGKKVSAEFSISVAQANEKFPAKAFINMKSISILPGQKEKVEQQDLTTGWGAGA